MTVKIKMSEATLLAEELNRTAGFLYLAGFLRYYGWKDVARKRWTSSLVSQISPLCPPLHTHTPPRLCIATGGLGPQHSIHKVTNWRSHRPTHTLPQSQHAHRDTHLRLHKHTIQHALIIHPQAYIFYWGGLLGMPVMRAVGAVKQPSEPKAKLLGEDPIHRMH